MCLLRFSFLSTEDLLTENLALKRSFLRRTSSGTLITYWEIPVVLFSEAFIESEDEEKRLEKLSLLILTSSLMSSFESLRSEMKIQRRRTKNQEKHIKEDLLP